MEEKEQKELELLAAKVRRDVVEMLLHRGYGHLGGSLSIVEVMAVLYGKQLKHDPKNPKWEDRDRLVLSKGHARAPPGTLSSPSAVSSTVTCSSR